jgi:hypothetical protein
MVKRKPDDEKKLAGTFRPDRAMPKQRAGVGVGRMPVGLNQFKPAARLWRLLAAELGDQLRPADGPALQLLCWHFGLAMEAMKHLAEVGPTVPDLVHGGVKKNPSGTILLQNSAAATALMREFGLTPKSRIVGVADGHSVSLQDMLAVLSTGTPAEGRS